jgi:transposase
MQVDFTTISRHRRKIKAFVATLGFSRATYVRFSEHERQEDWLQGIEEACHYFGGVPQEILPDYVARNIIGLMLPSSLCYRTSERLQHDRWRS